MVINCKKGITLIEMVIALSILIIFSTMVTASFASVERRQLHKAAVKLQADIRYAQSMALQKGTRYSIVFFVQDNSYIVRRMQNGRYVTIKQERFEDVYILNTTAVNNTISFTPRGTTGSPSTITLQNNSYRVNLTVSLGAGRVLIHEIIPI